MVVPARWHPEIDIRTMPGMRGAVAPLPCSSAKDVLLDHNGNTHGRETIVVAPWARAWVLLVVAS